MRSFLIALGLMMCVAPARAQQLDNFDPRVLLELGRAERRLGHAKEALSYYQRYLAADAQIDDATRLSVMKEIAELQPLVPPEPARLNLEAPRMAVRYETHHDRGLIAGGVTLLGTAYAGAIITGSIILDQNDRNENSSYQTTTTGPNSAAAGTLLIPVLGPIISAFCYLHASWALPWMLVDGAAQVGGLAMIITGAKIKKKVPVLDRVSVSPYGTPDGGGIRVSGRF